MDPDKTNGEKASVDCNETVTMNENAKELNTEQEKNNIIDENVQDDVSNDEKTKTETHADESLKNVPVDRGWAWVILFAAFLEVVIFGGLMKCYGVFFIAYQERFKSSASETSLILTVQNLTMSFTGIFVMTIGMKYMTVRTSILIGAVLHSLFYIVTAFAEKIGILYFTVGFMPGLAGAMIYLPIVSTINTYFNKYRGLANSLTMSGSSLGGLVFGPLYSMLFEEYGYTGTMLILSGILLNIVVTGVLMRPAEFYSKRKGNRLGRSNGDETEANMKLLPNGSGAQSERFRTNSNSRKSVDGESDAADTGTNNASTESAYGSQDSLSNEKVYRQDETINKHRTGEKRETRSTVDDTHIVLENKHKNLALRTFDRTVSYDPENLSSRHFLPHSLQQSQHKSHGSHLYMQVSKESLASPRKRTYSESSRRRVVHGLLESLSSSRVALYTSADIVCGSLANVNVKDNEGVSTKQETPNEITDSKKDTSGSTWSICLPFRNIVLSFLKTVFDISLLRSNVLLHYLLFAALILPGSVLPTIYFAPYAKEIGITSSEIGLMFSIIGCLDMVSRISLGFIADKKWMRPTSILAMTAIIVGTTSHLVRLFTTYWTLMIFVIIIGVCSGAYMSLYAVIILEHIGVDKFKGSLGWATMCHGVSMASFFPVTGYLRDETGSYFATFHLIGITLYMAATLSILLPFTSRRNKKI